MEEWLTGQGHEPWLVEIVGFGSVLLVATAVYFVGRWALVRLVHGLASQTQTHWDDELVRAGVFTRIAHIPPAFVVYYGLGLFPEIPEAVVDLVRMRPLVGCPSRKSARAIT